MPSGGDSFWDEAEALGRALYVHLAYWSALGLAGVAAAPAPAAAAEKPLPPPSVRIPARAAGCQVCPRRRAGGPASPGRGSNRPSLVLVGAEPDIYEGPSAKLLADIMTLGLKLDPDRYYVTTLLKCPPRPGEEPDGRAAALAACLAETRRELQRLAPRVVLALGEAPGAGLAGLGATPLGLLRNRTLVPAGLPEAWLRVTFSLRQMLEAPEIKLEAWKSDLYKIKTVLDKMPCLSADH